MLFNSLNFALFLPIIFALYWSVAKNDNLKKQIKLQNIILLFASYFFYACWDWRFVFLLLFSTFLDFFTGLKIQNTPKNGLKKIWLFISISLNIGFLMLFKYYNFFAQSFAETLKILGFQQNIAVLNIILPIGISFYTFHGLSYIIDIYKNKIRAESNFIDYAVFVSFFPLLVDGPIERATHLLPQIKQQRVFEYEKAADGLRQILWGLFKKIVIADQCAIWANIAFDNNLHSASDFLLGAFCFTIQIYGDFSGYSDIALGVARLFGIELLQNFAYPYFSKNIAEFWRRWHISLSSWFKDYVYIPLGGSRVGVFAKIRNTFIIFLISGFWHGANWTFLAWGLLNALYIMPSIIFNTNRTDLNIAAKGRVLPSFKEFFQIISTFALTVFAWIFFRATSLSHAFLCIKTLFSASLFTKLTVFPKKLLVLICFFIIIEWLGREQRYALAKLGLNWKREWRLLFYYILFFLVLWYNQLVAQNFIYFQF